MKKFLLAICGLTVSIVAGYILVYQLVMPTMSAYPRINRVMERFAYTDEVLWGFLVLSIWLLIVQIILRRVTVIYFYLFYSVYLFLLFTVLFTKATTYHSYSLNPFDFLVWNKRILVEAVLNLIYFIPLGALYAVKAKPWEMIATAFITILGIETLQYVFFLGTFAVSDIILNMVGVIIGYLLYRLLKKYMEK